MEGRMTARVGARESPNPGHVRAVDSTAASAGRIQSAFTSRRFWEHGSVPI